MEMTQQKDKNESVSIELITQLFQQLSVKEMRIALQKCTDLYFQKSRKDYIEAKKLSRKNEPHTNGSIFEDIVAHSLVETSKETKQFALGSFISEQLDNNIQFPSCKLETVINHNDMNPVDFFSKFPEHVVYKPPSGTGNLGPDLIHCMRNEKKEKILVTFGLKTSSTNYCDLKSLDRTPSSNEKLKGYVSPSKVRANFDSTDLEKLYTRDSPDSKAKRIRLLKLLNDLKLHVRVHIVLPRPFPGPRTKMEFNEKVVWKKRRIDDEVNQVHLEYDEIILDIDQYNLEKTNLLSKEVSDIVKNIFVYKREG